MKKYIIWGILCEGVLFMIVGQVADFDTVYQESAVRWVLLDPQKMLFNNMIYFTSLVCISYRNCLSTEVLVRCRANPFKISFEMMLNAIGVLVLYMLMLIVGTGMSSLLYGLNIQIDLRVFTLLCLFAILWYMIYVVFYIATQNHLIGVFVLGISQLLVLVSYLLLLFLYDIDIVDDLYNVKLLIIMIGLFAGMAFAILKRKEWI